MISLACFIIWIHAVVPHHHHNLDNSVCFVFNSELLEESHACESSSDFADGCCDEEKSPFELCKLQELLSGLVLSNREDDSLSWIHLSDVVVVVLYYLCDLDAPLGLCLFLDGFINDGWPDFCEGFPNASALRAPPVC